MAAPPLRTEIADVYPNPSSAVARSGLGKFWDYATGLLGSTGNAAEAREALGLLVGATRVGNCQITKSGANLLLSRFNGDGLAVDGEICSIPAGGLTLAPTGLTAGTTYYIYATAASSLVNALEASTTAPATDPDTGMRIKTGDSTRTLVGQARVVAGPAWVDTPTQRFVLSWFNQRRITAQALITADEQTSSLTFTEFTPFRTEFLNWAGNEVAVEFIGFLRNGTANGICQTSLGIDVPVLEGGSAFQSTTAGAIGPIYAISRTNPTEGYHFSSMWGFVSSGTGFWVGSANPSRRCVLRTMLMG